MQRRGELTRLQKVPDVKKEKKLKRSTSGKNTKKDYFAILTLMICKKS